MSHRNAPLTAAGRQRLIDRCQHRPIAHVAAEAGISRQCLSKWVARHRAGETLHDRSSAPHQSPTQLAPDVVAQIERLRRDHKWSARLIVVELANYDITVSVATVQRWLVRLGINRRRDLDTNGTDLRQPTQPTQEISRKIIARYPGHMVHVDVKKVGRIPTGGGWRIQPNSEWPRQ